MLQQCRIDNKDRFEALVSTFRIWEICTQREGKLYRPRSQLYRSRCLQTNTYSLESSHLDLHNVLRSRALRSHSLSKSGWHLAIVTTLHFSIILMNTVCYWIFVKIGRNMTWFWRYFGEISQKLSDLSLLTEFDECETWGGLSKPNGNFGWLCNSPDAPV